jgi:hypothetical protein
MHLYIISKNSFVAALMLQFLAGGLLLKVDSATLKNWYLTASGGQYFTEKVSVDSFTTDKSFQNFWLYAGLPSFSIAGKKIFSAVEIELMHRQITFAGNPLHDPSVLFQRYGLFAGVRLIDRPRQKGSLMAGPGIATDFTEVSTGIGYLHLIYDHRFTFSDKLQIGLGIVFQYHFDAWRSPVNLLPTVKWQIAPHTQLDVTWDNLQLKQGIFKRTMAVGEVRYDLSFFRSRNRLSYELETVSAGGGFDIQVSRRYSVRMRYQELVMHREIIRRNGGALVDVIGGRGRLLRVVLVRG